MTMKMLSSLATPRRKPAFLDLKMIEPIYRRSAWLDLAGSGRRLDESNSMLPGISLATRRGNSMEEIGSRADGVCQPGWFDGQG